MAKSDYKKSHSRSTQVGRNVLPSISELNSPSFDLACKEILSNPYIGPALKKVMAKTGRSLKTMMVAYIANLYQQAGEPLPRELREHLLAHAETLRPEERRRFLRAHLN